MTTPSPVTRRFLFVDETLTGAPTDAAGKPNGYTRIGVDGTIYIVKNGAYVRSSGGVMAFADLAFLKGESNFPIGKHKAADPGESISFSQLGVAGSDGRIFIAVDRLVPMSPTRNAYVNRNNLMAHDTLFSSLVAGEGLYRIVLEAEFVTTSGVTAGDVVTLRVSDGGQLAKRFDHTITAQDITAGSLYIESEFMHYSPGAGAALSMEVGALPTTLLTYCGYNLRAVNMLPPAASVAPRIGEFSDITKTGNVFSFTAVSLAEGVLNYQFRLRRMTDGTSHGVITFTREQVLAGSASVTAPVGTPLGWYQLYADDTGINIPVLIGMAKVT